MASPPRLVLGTAGHVDHGKTALVRALTGVDTDRLPEEKARGISIELGFAPLDLAGGVRLSVVDVPGHERLVRTMVAGATGIDLVLLVVAADEGVRPQTREHLAICELLGIGRGVVALSRCDLAGEEAPARAEREVRALLAGGALAGAPLVRVSAVTGAGLEALRAQLARLAAHAGTRTPRRGPPRLAVDRAFTVRGFGTVVTGTLVGGRLRAGDALEIAPHGRATRVRGLHSHDAAVPVAEPGVRTAVNLHGVDLAEVARGDVVAAPGAVGGTRRFDARLRWLAGAPPLAERTSVELLVGTSERRARVSPIAAASLAPGGCGFARVRVEGPALALLPGDRFVVRGFARLAGSGNTLGGGTVLDVAPSRRRRSDPALLAELAALERGDPLAHVVLQVGRAGRGGLALEALRRVVGLGAEELEAAVATLVGSGRVARGEAGRLFAPGVRHAREARAAADAGRDDAERALAERLRQDARAAGLTPPTLEEWSLRLGAPAQRLRPLLAQLAREGALVRAPRELWFDREAVDALRARVVAALRSSPAGLETPAYKALIGTTRKHAVPLMELFDGERTTLRVGNRRILRGAR